MSRLKLSIQVVYSCYCGQNSIPSRPKAARERTKYPPYPSQTHNNFDTAQPHPCPHRSVRGSIGETSLGDANTLVGSIIHAVEPLKPRLATNEIQTRVRRGPESGDDEVDAVSFAANRGV